MALKSRNVICSLALVLLCLTTASWATNSRGVGRASFERFTSTDHPALGTVFFTLVDSLGYVWWGSQSGLLRYDGAQIKAYRPSADSVPNWGSVFSVAQADERHLWVASRAGLFLFDRAMGTFASVEAIGANHRCYRILPERGQKIWVTTHRAILLYHPESQSVERFDPRDFIADTAQQANYRTYGFRLPWGELLVGTYNYCLVWDEAAHTFTSFAIPRTDPLRPSHLGAIAAHHSDRNLLYLGTEQGLFLYNRLTGASRRLIEADRVDALLVEPSGRVWAGTSRGLFSLDAQGDIEAHHAHSPIDPRSLSDNLIHHLTFDTKGDLWVGTEFGAVRTNPSSENHVFDLMVQSADGLQGMRPTHAIRVGGSLFVVASTNGVAVCNHNDGSIRWLSTQAASNRRLLSNDIRYLFADQITPTLIWIASSQGLHSYDVARDQTRSYNVVCDDPNKRSAWLYSINQDQSGRLYLATFENGVYVVGRQVLLGAQDNSVVRAERHYASSSARAWQLGVDDQVPSVFFSKSDTASMWVYYGRTHGILRYGYGSKTGADGRSLVQFSLSNGNFTSNGIYGMFDASKKRILVWHAQGFSSFDPITTQVEPISIEGLAPTVRGVLEVGDGNQFWLHTNWGLQLVELASRRVVRSIDLSAQMPGVRSVAYDSSSHRLYYAAPNAWGFVSTDSTRLPLNLRKRVVVNGLWFGDASIEPGQTYGDRVVLPCDAAWLDGASVRLYESNNQNMFSVGFSTLGNTKQSSAIYRYRLVGLSDDWQLTSVGEQRIRFTNLPSGRYTFEVVQIDPSGSEVSNVSQISIVVVPPWYRSQVAYVIYGLLCVVLVFLGVWWLRLGYMRRVDRLEREQSINYSQMKISFLTQMFRRIEAPLSRIVAHTDAEDGQVAEAMGELRSISSQFLGIADVQNGALNALKKQIATMPVVDSSDRLVLSDAPENGSDKLMRKIRSVVEQHISEVGLSVGILAQEVQISPKRIYHTIKQSTDLSPTDYIRQIRLERAAVLLARGGFSVSEVLYLVGFSSHSYFTKCFKARYGVNPKEYSKSHTTP